MPRISLVGYGRIALKHLEVFQALGCPIASVCDASADRRRAAASESGLARSYASVAEMIEAERPDGIVACVSFDQNFSVARAAVSRGVPVLLEKPPGLSAAECRGLLDLSSRRGAPILPAFNRRHYSVLRKALEDAGGAANVTETSVVWTEEPERLLKRYSRLQVSRMVFANTIHGLDMMTHLSGPIPQPALTARSLGEPFRWQALLHGVSDRGVLASFASSWDSPGGWRFVFCTRGRRYTFAPLETCSVEERGQGATRRIEPDDCDRRFKPGFFEQARMFLEVASTRRVPAGFGLETAIPAMELAERITEACLAAHRAAPGSAPI